MMGSLYPSSAEYPTALPAVIFKPSQFSVTYSHQVPYYYQCPRCKQSDLDNRHDAVVPRRLGGQSLHPINQHSQPARILLYIDLIISFLCLLPTLGIPKVYHSLFRYNPADAPENRAERGCALPSLSVYPRWHDEIVDRIASIWRASLALSSAGVLTSVMGFFQLLSVRNNVIFTSLVVGACVLTWSSTICALLYTGYKQSFLTHHIAVQWALADSPHCPFWRLLALPVTLLAWGVFLCFTATIYVSFTGFSNAQPTATSPTAIGGIFVLGISVIAAFSIYNAARRLSIPGSM